ncbi:MAG: class I SAM-dependent methyltransferase [Bdellovibrionota bacterium]
MTQALTSFDPNKFKETTREQWNSAAEAWDRWGTLLNAWLGPSTEAMFDLMGLRTGQSVLDVAAGAGEQSVAASRRVGPTGRVLATDISPKILEYADRVAQKAGLKNIQTRVLDGENLDVPEASFDTVISRVGLIYFPDQQRALHGMKRALKPGGKIGAVVYSTPENNKFFSIPVSIIRRRAQLPAPQPGQPGPFSLGSPGVIEKAFLQAGFGDVRTQLVSSPVRLSTAEECVRFEKESFGALHQMMSSLSSDEKEDTWKEILSELKKFEVAGKGFAGPCEMLLAVATK